MEEERKVLQEEGENIIPITHETCVIDDEGTTVSDKIGVVSLLNTNSRNLVGAINEVFGDTVKREIIDALVEKGIEINSGMSWKDIIDKINITEVSSGGLDVISATELPATGKENQICVITDNPADVVVSITKDDLTDNNILLLQTTEGTCLSIIQDNTTINYYFASTIQGVDRLASYYYQNNIWNVLTVSQKYLLEEGTLVNIDYSGNINTVSSYCVYEAGEGIHFKGTGTPHIMTTFTKPINFSLYNNIKVTLAKCTGTSTVAGFSLRAYNTSRYNANSSATTNMTNYLFTTTALTIPSTNNEATYTVDISSWTGEGYLGLYNSTYRDYYITELVLY